MASYRPGSVVFDAEELAEIEWGMLVLECGVAPSEVELLSDEERWLLLSMKHKIDVLKAGKGPYE